MTIWYCTREDVLSAADVHYPTTYIDTIDQAIAAASVDAEGAPLRRFYPIENDTIVYDWPAADTGAYNKLFFSGVDFISVDSLTVAGSTVSSTDYVLQPPNWGPPYTWLKLKDTASNFMRSNTDRVNAISITGTTGYSADTAKAGTLTDTITSTDTTAKLSVGSSVGVGSLLKIGTEWVTVKDRFWDVSGDTLAGAVALQASADSFTGTATGSYYRGEFIRIDTEKMLVESYNTATKKLVVKRAVQGTTLAAHTAGTAIERLTSYELNRGINGSTAAAHTAGVDINVWVIPSLLRQLVKAEAITTVQQTVTAYARTIGTGDNQQEARGIGLEDLRHKATLTYRRTPIYRRL